MPGPYGPAPHGAVAPAVPEAETEANGHDDGDADSNYDQTTVHRYT